MSKSWPLGVVGLCMTALGVFGIWVVAVQNRLFSPASALPERILVFGLLGFVTLMGIWSIVIVAVRWNDPQAFVPGFLLAYRDAWRRFTRQKWLLALAGFIALVNILGAVTEFALQRYYLADYIDEIMRSGGLLGMISIFTGFPSTLAILESMPRTVNGTVDYFPPDPGLSGSLGAVGFFVLFVLALLPWINRRLTTLQDQSADASAIRFFRKLIWPIGILSLLTAVWKFYALWYTYAVFTASITAHGHEEIARLVLPNAISTFITEILRNAVVIPLLIGGIAGSLKRTASGDSISAESFLEDSVRTYTPIAGIFLLFYLTETFIAIPGLVLAVNNITSISPPWYTALKDWFGLLWRLLMVVLMFAPYAVFAGAGSMWRGLWESIDAWLNCGYNLLSFTALGIAGLTVVLTGSNVFGLLVGTGASPLSIIPILIGIVIHVAVSVFMAVAVWEFYAQIRAASASDEQNILATVDR